MKKGVNGKQKLRITVISNVLLAPDFEKKLAEKFFNDTVMAEIDFFSIEEFNLKCSLEQCDIVVIIPYVESFLCDVKDKMEVDEPMEICEYAYQYFYNVYVHVKNEFDGYVIWFGFEECYDILSEVLGNRITDNKVIIDKLNLKMFENLDAQDIYIDTSQLIAKIGICRAYDIKGKYRWNKPYSVELIELIICEIYKQYLIINSITPKCIVLDCDNVLWGGILSEDSKDGIALGKYGIGRPYWDFQKYLLQLRERGVILAVCSKNDEEDILEVFDKHPEILLKEKDFDLICANWNNKVENMKIIIDSLNIAPEHIVFVDDSRIEIEAIKYAFPKITTIQFCYDTIYSKLSCFNLPYLSNLESVEQRHETYKSSVKRDNLYKMCGNYEEYLKALEIRIDIHMTLPNEYMRIAELTLRTNKITNGNRYNCVELREKCRNSNYKLYSVYLEDRYSNMGLVGAIGTEGKVLDLFSVSCRAIGHGLEEQLCEFIKRMEVEKCIFSSTGKNGDLHLLLKSYGIVDICE